MTVPYKVLVAVYRAADLPLEFMNGDRGLALPESAWSILETFAANNKGHRLAFSSAAFATSQVLLMAN